MPKTRLTQAAVDRINPPAEGRVEVWDTVLPGFGLRIASSGRKTWQVLYRVQGRPVRETLGTLATIPRVDDARSAARASLARANAGGNPVAERKATERDTVSALFGRYMDGENGKGGKRGDAAYLAETRRTFAVDVLPVIGAMPVTEVSRRHIREILDSVVDRGSEGHANHVLAYLRAFFGWCVEREKIDANPAAGIKKPAAPGERDRVLTDDEIAVFWRACDALNGVFGPLFKMLLLTGQRRGEVAEAVWTEFDLVNAIWHLPGGRTKNGRPHDVALAPQMLAILDALPRWPTTDLLFTATGRPLAGFDGARLRIAAIMQAITGKPVEPFTIHDLRRTAASGMAGIGIAPHVVDKILNHSTGKISGIARIYNRHEYTEERAVALARWAAHIEGLVKPPKGNVAAFRRRS
jgi:integrase